MNNEKIRGWLDEKIYECFAGLLCYYHAQEADVPPRLRLVPALNRWPNPALACMDLQKMAKDEKVAREMARALAHVQACGRVQ